MLHFKSNFKSEKNIIPVYLIDDGTKVLTRRLLDFALMCTKNDKMLTKLTFFRHVIFSSKMGRIDNCLKYQDKKNY